MKLNMGRLGGTRSGIRARDLLRDLLTGNIYAKQKHLECKKVRGQEEPATKSSDIK